MSRVITPRGQPASAWTSALASLSNHEPTDLLGLGRGDRLVLAVPHPDDETLAVGGILQRLLAAGVQIEVVLATNGEGAYGEVGVAAADLARVRRMEFDNALASLGLGAAEVYFLDLPDGAVCDHEAELVETLVQVLAAKPIAGQRRTAVLAPWISDPHPDHQAVGRATGIAARRAGLMRWSYPVWMRHGYAPDDSTVPWTDLRRISLTADEQTAKSAAIASYASQTTSASGSDGAVLPSYVLQHFADGHELLIRPAPDDNEVAAHFEALYEGDLDPWQVATSWYERRKRAVLLATLPQAQYRCGWEPGCSVGHLTAELAQRCDRLVSSDISTAAVAAARRIVRSQHVTIDVAQTPWQQPDLASASCDLVVLSELLYYLPEPARLATVALAVRLLQPGGQLVVAHWKHHPDDAHLSGEQANAEAVASVTADPAVALHVVHHVDEHFVLDVLVLDGGAHDATAGSG